MSKQAQLPDGTIVEFPDDVTPEEMTEILNGDLSQAPRAAPPRPERKGITQALAENVAQPFNKGLSAIPGMLPGGDDLLFELRKMGLLAGEGQDATGIVPRAMEIAGGSVLPGGAVAGRGAQVLARPIQGMRSTLDDIAAKSIGPGGARAEVLASGGAGLGGEVAADIDPELAGLGELIGGGAVAMTPAMVAPIARMLGGGAGRAADVAAKVPGLGAPVRVVRDIIEGARGLTNPHARASREVQGRVSDPASAADRIDPSSPMPPARQIGEERLLQLESAVRKDAPPADAMRVEEDIARAVNQARGEAIDIGGDTRLPRQVIGQQGKQTVQRQAARAEQATQEMEAALKPLDVASTQPDLSRDARQKIITAMEEGRAIEREAWGQIDQELPRTLDNMRSATDDIVAETGVFNRADAIPPKIRQALDYEGDVVFRDVHGLRQVVQDEIRNEINQQAPSWGKIRQLRKLESALLDDMSAGDNEALTAARAVSRDFNNKFTAGKMGQILGEKAGVERVPDADTLSAILSGQFAARDIEQLLSASPAARGDVIDFIRAGFMDSAVGADSVNQSQANRYISKLRKKRVFEVFPELEAELTNATSKAARSDTLAKRAELVKKRGGARFDRDSNKSLAGVFLDKPPGEETDLLLKARNPDQLARKLKARMGGNEAAEEGLRQSFRERLWTSAKEGLTPEGADRFSARKFARSVNDHVETMQALGFSEQHVQNMRKLAAMMVQSERNLPANAQGPIFTDIPGQIVNRISQVAGARMGSWANRLLGGSGAGAGVSLQAAQMGSSTARQMSSSLRADPAQRLILDAMDDPSLMRSLLLRQDATEAAKKEAATRLNAWAAGAGLTDEDED